MLAELKGILHVFLPDQILVSFEEISSGHINDTYLGITDRSEKYILQKINKGVFNDVPGLIMNKVQVSLHLHEKLSDLKPFERNRKILTFLRAEDGAYYVKDDHGDFWNVTIFIKDSQTFETVTARKTAHEGGKLFGQFIQLTQDFDPKKLVEVIPRFHDMTFRFGQLEEALVTATEERKTQAKTCIDNAFRLKDEMHILQHLKEAGDIKLRVTHNDTKISNALFDLEGNGLCVIDTDTIMPGIIHYDFGDAIRTICTTAAEDEQDLEKVAFNLEFYHAYSEGFIQQLQGSISEFELQYFPLAAKTMIYIMAIRFLADYLNNDIYYKTKYDTHNLVRSKNQFKLIQSLSEQLKVSVN